MFLLNFLIYSMFADLNTAVKFKLFPCLFLFIVLERISQELGCTIHLKAKLHHRKLYEVVSNHS
jgi:hypothetical protein